MKDASYFSSYKWRYCWPTTPIIVVSCRVRLHVAKSLTGLKLCATTLNNTKQHVTGCANGRNL